MKSFNTLNEAKSVINGLIKGWSGEITITDVYYTKGIHGYFVDMTVDRVSYYFLSEIERVTGDTNPIIMPKDEETLNIGLYIIIK